MAETFTFEGEDGSPSLETVAKLDTMVTVCDGFNFLRELEGQELLLSRDMAAYQVRP